MSPPDNAYDDEISLEELARTVFEFVAQTWRWMALGAASFGLAAGGFTLVSPKYESSGMLRTPGLSIDIWRDTTEILRSTSAREAFVSLGPDTPAARFADAHFGSEAFWENQVKLTSLTRPKDPKELLGAEKQQGALNSLEIKASAPNPDEAHAGVLATGEFILDTLLWRHLRQLVQSTASSAETEKTQASIESQFIKADEDIRKAQRRISELKAVLSNYPEARRLESNTVVSIEGGGNRFMSPIAQIVALETAISDANELKRNADRLLIQAKWSGLMAQRIAGLPEQHRTGQSLLTALETEVKNVFDGEGTLPQPARELQLGLQLQLLESKERYLELHHFLTPPSVPEGSSRSGARYIAIGAIGGLFLSIFVLLMVRLFKRLRNAPAAA